MQFDFGNGNTLLLGGVTAEGLDDHGLWEVFEDTDPVTGDRVDVMMLKEWEVLAVARRLKEVLSGGRI